MKKFLIAIIVFNISFINLYAKGIALSTQSDTNTYSWIKGRQIISFNLSPGYAGLFPPMVNTIFDNYETFTGLANINLGEIDKYLTALDAKGSFWYVPTISYTLLLHPRIGVEIGFGVQSMTFQLSIPRDKVGDIVPIGTGGLPGGIKDNIDTLVGSDTYLKTSLYYFPATIGLKFYGGKKKQVVNTFRFGVEVLMYDIETQNGVSGLHTKRHTVDTTMYLSYELGWTIELFPDKEWPVKPYIDISLFEIGYYVRSGIPGLYADIREGIGFFGSGLIDINTIIPSWDSFPTWANYVSAIRFAIFPRIGFSLRF
ncbi:hypothetical protein [Brachyspira sp.]|uniref:hypothetical protein n=1 Tax=Brachyspira sp. TaxID=1977261 RepID=UPI0026307530|nr:hypothetical protein [Brachyspira sp.]